MDNEFYVFPVKNQKGEHVYTIAGQSFKSADIVKHFTDNMKEYSVLGNAFMFTSNRHNDPADKIDNILIFNN